MNTIADTIDALITVDIKNFMNQENFHNNAYKDMTRDQLLIMLEKSKSLNLQRVGLIDRLNTQLNEAFQKGEAPEFPRHKTEPIK